MSESARARSVLIHFTDVTRSKLFVERTHLHKASNHLRFPFVSSKLFHSFTIHSAERSQLESHATNIVFCFLLSCTKLK